MSDPLVPDYLIGMIFNGLPGGMPAWNQQGLSDQDIRDIATLIIQENRFHQAAGLSPQKLARSDAFWVTAAEGPWRGLPTSSPAPTCVGSHGGRPRRQGEGR